MYRLFRLAVLHLCYKEEPPAAVLDHAPWSEYRDGHKTGLQTSRPGVFFGYVIIHLGLQALKKNKMNIETAQQIAPNLSLNERFPGYDESLEVALDRLISDDLKRIAQLPLSDQRRETVKVTVQAISKHFFLYCRKNLMISTKAGSLIPFELNSIQKLFTTDVLQDLADGTPVRYIILKARQMGLSTVIGALCYWWTATHRYVSSAIVAHEEKAMANIYQMFKRYYENSSPTFKPKQKYKTKTDGLTFDDPTAKPEDERKGRGRGLKSEVKTFVASGASGRSNTIQFLHASEVAFWRDAAETVSGLMQTIPSLPQTFIFLESTANGVGDYFYETWQAAVRGDSVFKPRFYAWWQHDEYEFNVTSGHMEFKKEEDYLIDIMRNAGLNDLTIRRKLTWWRWKQKEFAANPDKLMQEYPATPEEAFIASGRPRFDLKMLAKMRDIAADPENKPKYYFLEKKNRNTVVSREAIVTVLGAAPSLKIWELPEPGEKFVIGADIAEGLEIAASGKEGDYSAATVVRERDCKVVARWRGHIDPDIFGEELFSLGIFYNHALIGVEVNNHGLTTIAKLKNLYYRNMYRRERGQEEWFETSTAQLGWKTTSKSKPLMIDGLATAIRENVIIDYDSTFINECMTYVIDENGRTNATIGTHDDTVIATAIAFQLFDWGDHKREFVPTKKPLEGLKLLGKNKAPLMYKKRLQKLR